MIALILSAACEIFARLPIPRATELASTAAAIQPTAQIADLAQRLPGRIAFTRGDNALWIIEPISSAIPRKMLIAQQNRSVNAPSWSHDGRWIDSLTAS